MNVHRLLKLADFLDDLDDEKFYFGSLVAQVDDSEEEPCGSVCCALGWTPMVFPGLVKWVESFDCLLISTEEDGHVEDDLWGVASIIFDIDRSKAAVLFNPDTDLLSEDYECFEQGNYFERLGAKASPKQVADRIRRFVEKEMELYAN